MTSQSAASELINKDDYTIGEGGGDPLSVRHVHFSSSKENNKSATTSTTSTATTKNDDTTASQFSHAELLAEKHQQAMQRLFEERSKEEQIMLRPFQNVLCEDYPQSTLNSFMLYRATENPECIRAWLLSDDGKEGIMRYLREQMYPIVKEQVFLDWKEHLKWHQPEDLFWSFVTAIFIDEGIQKMVEGTWKGSKESLDCIMEYYKMRFSELLDSPFDPKNANRLMVAMFRLVQMEVIPMKMTKIILNGKLKPIIVPLSRNAHRKRKQEMKQSEHEAQTKKTMMETNEDDANEERRKEKEEEGEEGEEEADDNSNGEVIRLQ